MTAKIDRREFLITSGAAVGLAGAAATPSPASAARVQILGLRVDHLKNPLGLENRRPRLSWRLQSEARNVRQSMYRVRVASTEQALSAGRGDLWDSGKVSSRKSFGIEYRGRELRSRERCFWQVEVWDGRGEPAAPSEIAWWEMGLLKPEDWSAQWIAVETAVDRADREAGLQWIWGKSTAKEGSRKFRFAFDLPRRSTGGELFAVTNDWYWWAQITRIWVDGEPIAGRGAWVDRSDSQRTMSPDVSLLTRQQIALRPMAAGRHVIAVDVATQDPKTLKAAMKDCPYVSGFAALVRFNLDNGETLRFGSGLNWKTSQVQASGWYTSAYDDAAWDGCERAHIEGYQPGPVRPAMQLRRQFSIKQRLRKARLYATALGVYEARLNGQKIGDAWLTPEVSQYAKRVLYQSYDVTSMIQSGDNALALTVGDGWYAGFDGRFAWGEPPRRVLAQLELFFEDGTKEILVTGPGWRISESPIQRSEIKGGELYDARLEQAGWDTAGFDDGKWNLADLAESPPCLLVAQTVPPIREVQTLKPREISQPKPGVYVADFGQPFSGSCRLRTKGQRGSRIELRFSERVSASGEVNPISGVSDPHDQPRSDVFILKGDPAGEVFEPHFTFRGFRYVEIHGLQAAPTAESIEGVFIHSDLEITGQLRTDSTLIEQIWRSTLQTLRGNFVSIATDNNSRESRGWVEQFDWDAAAFNMDVHGFMARQMQNLVDDQDAEGAFPMRGPEPIHGNAYAYLSGAVPGWAETPFILASTAWRQYGDTTLIETHWEAMNRHLDFVLKHNPDLLWRNQRDQDYGDWGAPRPTSFEPAAVGLKAAPLTQKDVLATAYWAHAVNLLGKMAVGIGRTHDAERLHALFERIRRAFNAAFVQPDGTVANGSQTSYVLALRFGLLPDDLREAAAQRLADDIRARGTALTTGIRGTAHILDVLADTGYGDLAYGLLLRTEYPSWGYMIENGATTLWEFWDGHGALSQGGYMGVCGFLIRRLAGVEPLTLGFETIRVKPLFDRRVGRGGGDYDSVMGRISTDWSRHSGGDFSLKVNIPANATALIHLPAAKGSWIRESRRNLTTHRTVRLVSRSDTEAVIEVGSGTYSFEVIH